MALVWELVLEELFSGEVLEIRIVDPALARAFHWGSTRQLLLDQPPAKPTGSPNLPHS